MAETSGHATGHPTVPKEPTVLTVLTTTDTKPKAEALARGAVEQRLAACAQIAGPVTSVYRWDGAIETDEEWQLLLKTTTERYPALQQWLTEHHDYDTPEIIATPVVHGSAAYLDWVREETRGANREATHQTHQESHPETSV